MMTIKFKPVRQIKKTIDYSKFYSIYDAVEIINMLQNREVNYGRKYYINYEVFEDSQPVYKDEIGIGFKESINFFEDTLIRVKKLFPDGESEDGELLISKIKQMESEYYSKPKEITPLSTKETILSKLRHNRERTERFSVPRAAKELENRLKSLL